LRFLIKVNTVFWKISTATNLELLKNAQLCEARPGLSHLLYFLFESMNHFVRFERKSFFVAGKAMAKRLGAEDGNRRPNNLF